MATCLLLLLPGMLLGCGEPAAPTPPSSPASAGQPLTIFLRRRPPEPRFAEVVRAARALIDPEAGERGVGTGGGEGEWGGYIDVVPVRDVAAAVAAIDFGAVLAFVPEQRRVLIDVDLPPRPRPAAGWPGADVFAAIVRARFVDWLVHTASSLTAASPDEAGVLVCLPGDAGAWQDKQDPVLRRLLECVGTERVRSLVTGHGFVRELCDVDDLILAFVRGAEFDQLRRRLGDDVLAAYEDRRVLLLVAGDGRRWL